MKEKYKYVKIIKKSEIETVWYNDKIGKIVKINARKLEDSCFKVLDFTCNNHLGVFVSPDMFEYSTKEDYDNQNQFILPEKWCVKDTFDEKSNGLYEYANINGARPPYGISKVSHYYHFPSFKNCTTASKIEENYIEITLDQFLKYVLNKEPIKEDMTALIKLLEGL